MERRNVRILTRCAFHPACGRVSASVSPNRGGPGHGRCPRGRSLFAGAFCAPSRSAGAGGRYSLRPRARAMGGGSGREGENPDPRAWHHPARAARHDRGHAAEGGRAGSASRGRQSRRSLCDGAAPGATRCHRPKNAAPSGKSWPGFRPSIPEETIVTNLLSSTLIRW